MIAWKACFKATLDAADDAERLKPLLGERYEEVQQERLAQENAAAEAAEMAAAEAQQTPTEQTGNIGGNGVEADTNGNTTNANGVDVADGCTSDAMIDTGAFTNTGEQTAAAVEEVTHTSGTTSDDTQAGDSFLIPLDIGGAFDAVQETQRGYGGIVMIEPGQLYRMITDDVRFLLLDMRPVSEYKVITTNIDVLYWLYLVVEVLQQLTRA